MTREEAAAMVRGLFRAFGEDSNAGLNAAGFAGIAISGARVAFAFDKSNGTLASVALIYQFPRSLRDDRWRKIQTEARFRLPDGVNLRYDSDSRYVSLEHVDSTPVPADEFAADVMKLSARCVQWDLDILDQVLDAADAS